MKEIRLTKAGKAVAEKKEQGKKWYERYMETTKTEADSLKEENKDKVQVNGKGKVVEVTYKGERIGYTVIMELPVISRYATSGGWRSMGKIWKSKESAKRRVAV